MPQSKPSSRRRGRPSIEPARALSQRIDLRLPPAAAAALAALASRLSIPISAAARDLILDGLHRDAASRAAERSSRRR